ncbi:MAG TPA: tetratricopeptide repeat protein [Gemmatimonadota bacterium]|nr:tetratricopeptide repeat protein [Gemmatimonadota bacterium]
MIQLRTLGGLQLRDRRGRDLCGQLQPKRLCLLVYLAHPPRRFHRRDLLLALFWPELGQTGARNSLRQALFSLRQTLARGVLAGRGYEDVAVTDLLASDVVAFEAALEAGQMERALELYRGPFLEGFHAQNVAREFEDWLETERVRLRQRAVGAALALVEREESRGNLTGGVRWTRKALRLDPDNETILRKLVDLLTRAGDRAGAVRAFEAFAQRTRTQYDLEPDDQTQALIREVRAREEPPPPSPMAQPVVQEPPTSFIGREAELERLERLLADPGVRLVTLTGLGGAGKTRLALRLAERVEGRFRDGLARVALADVQEPDYVLWAIARGLGLAEDHRRGPGQALREFFSNRELLLVLDGFEQVRAAGSELLELLQGAPGLKILTTSNAPLKLSGEHEFPVPALSLPEPNDGGVQFPLNSEAVALFAERARAVRPDFRLTAKNLAAIAEICVRLDGLPLAIELAAARVKILTPQAIAEKLEERFAILTGGPADRPLRHRTLEAAIGWNYELLEEGERALFRRLGAFAGGFGLELAEPVFETEGISSVDLIDGLATLVDHSLLHQLETAGEPTFRIPDTVHAYAGKLLAESGEEEAVRRRHARSLLAWVEEGQRWYCTPEQDAWFGRLGCEHDNVRRAVRFAIDRKDAALAVRLAAAVWPFWWSCGYQVQARGWLEEILALRGRVPRAARAKALLGASLMAAAAADHEGAAERARESAELSSAAGDTRGHLRALEMLGFVRLEAGQVEEAESAFQASLEGSRAAGDDRRRAIALNALGQVAIRRGDDLQAERFLKEGLALARQRKLTIEIGQGLLFLGDLALRAGDLDRATELCGEALAIYRGAGQKVNVAWALSCLGRVLAERGQFASARQAHAEALPLFQELGYLRGVAKSVAGFAQIALAEGNPARAARLLGGIELLLERSGDHLPPDDGAFVGTLGATARERLRKATFTSSWAAGGSLSADALVALALAEEPVAKRQALG